ncbi:MAG: ABC transporter permease [Rhizobiaceae bacterium]
MNAKKYGSPYFSAVIVLLAWWLIVPLLNIEARFLPTLAAVVADGRSIWDELLRSTIRTVTETAIGFVLGAALGFAFGVVFSQSRLLERSVFPIFIALQTVPIIAFGAIVVIWFGNSIASKVVIALYLTMFPVAVSTLRGLYLVDQQRIDLMRSFGGSRWQIFMKLALPSAMPTIMVALQLSISLSLAGAIVGETFGDTIGLGVLMLQAFYYEQFPRIWLLILVCGVIGSVLYGMLVWLERKYVWWRVD